jgi:beta-glucosidase
MLWYVVQQLPEYENDPVVVNAMREACHYNLYALANSSAMNGIGPDSVIHAITPPILSTVRTAMVVSWVLTLACAALWIRGAGKLKQTEEYAAWKAYKKAKKAK